VAVKGLEGRERVEFGNRIPREVSSHEREARDAWNDIKTTTNSIVLEKFIASNWDTVYGPLARARIEELKKAGSREWENGPAGPRFYLAVVTRVLSKMEHGSMQLVETVANGGAKVISSGF
jgi:hypothetical protein